MKCEAKRIFISDLPETATEDEIRAAFRDYCTVGSVEIKERRELGPKNHSLFFAYINVHIDDASLQKCFRDFNSTEWHGRYVQLQIARESFLDRLRREREQKDPDGGSAQVEAPPAPKPANGIKKVPAASSPSSDSSSESEDEKPAAPKPKLKTAPKAATRSSSSSSSSSSGDEAPAPKDPPIEGFVIKSNKGKRLGTTGLVIEGVGREPILKIDLSSKRKPANNSEANAKRLQSMAAMRQGYQSQRSAIAAALAKVDVRPVAKGGSKIIDFNGTSDKVHEKKKKKSLFDDDDDDDGAQDAGQDFRIKEQFEGKKGQKLLELQSKFKNDGRFAMDKRFLDDDDDDGGDKALADGKEISVEQEKTRELEILGEILGKTVLPKRSKPEDERHGGGKMLRFDPTQPDHHKYQLDEDEEPKRKRRKHKDEPINDKRIEQSEQPEVSKEVFYKVADDLKQSLVNEQPSEGFSLLSMFGRRDAEPEERQLPAAERKLDGNVVGQERNPFRYDSSDDEDETDGIPEKAEVVGERKDGGQKKAAVLWSETFFFKDDDYRLQEGFDFIERMKGGDAADQFGKLRRDLKEIVRAKVRNGLRRDRPLKKKLGGNKKRKNVRIKKALKR